MLSDNLIYLRKLEKPDLVHTWKWLHRPDIFSAIGVKIPVSQSEQERWFDRTDSATDKIIFAICMRETDEHIGNVSLDLIDQRHRNARLAIFLGEPSVRGSGIGTRAIQILACYAFEMLNLHKIYCKTNDRPELVRFYQNLGFVLEGRMREHEFSCGRYRDKLLFSLLRDDYTHTARNS